MVKGFGVADVCVECSLSNDILCDYRFCKHSKSPIFNRSMRTLNRLPIYLGEDICDKINREAVLKELPLKALFKDIRVFDKNTLNSPIKYGRAGISVGRYEGGMYSCYSLKTYHWIYKEYYPTGYTWIDHTSNRQINGWSTGVKAGSHIESYYNDTKRAKDLFKRFVKAITHKRILKKFNLDMEKLYGDTNERWLKKPLYDDTHYWFKQALNGYHPLKSYTYGDSSMRASIIHRSKYICNVSIIASCREMAVEYDARVDRARIKRLKRFKKLFIETEDKHEQAWYMMQMGMLCYKEEFHTGDRYPYPYMYDRSKKYDYLGHYRGHISNFHLNSKYNNNQKKFYDLRHYIYRLINTDEIFNDWDIYDDYDTTTFENMLHTNIEIPKINHIKHHYKTKVLPEIITYCD